jgi:hypothetical protein
MYSFVEMINDELELHWLHNRAENLEVDGRWQEMAHSNLRDEFSPLAAPARVPVAVEAYDQRTCPDLCQLAGKECCSRRRVQTYD